MTDTGSVVIALICSVDAEVKSGSIFFKGILKQHLYEELHWSPLVTTVISD